MLNFTVGPVQSDDTIRKIGSEQVPYFRTQEFSNLMLENENLIREFANASKDDKVVFITGSGTASMEASVINTLTCNDKVLVVNGGSFGQRFVDILNIYSIPYQEIKLEFGQPLTKQMLYEYNNQEFTAFIVNLHETSTGVLYDLDLISEFCINNNLFLIVDAISAFLAEKIDFSKNYIDILITGSQKALACPPGVSIMVLSNKAINKINEINPKCLYLNLKLALDNMLRGQTPFTPAVSILIQINQRLRNIKANGGVNNEIARIKNLATYFREKIKDLPFEIIKDSPSNAVTAIQPLNVSAYQIFLKLKDDYNIWVCPNGGALQDQIFRVGHIGDLTVNDFDVLINALYDLKNKNQL